MTSSNTYGEEEDLKVVYKFIGQNWHLAGHLSPNYGTPRVDSRPGVSSTVRRLNTRETKVAVLMIHIDRYIRITESPFLFVESGILGFGIRILSQGFRNSVDDWAPESTEFCTNTELA